MEHHSVPLNYLHDARVSDLILDYLMLPLTTHGQFNHSTCLTRGVDLFLEGGASSSVCISINTGIKAKEVVKDSVTMYLSPLNKETSPKLMYNEFNSIKNTPGHILESCIPFALWTYCSPAIVADPSVSSTIGEIGTEKSPLIVFVDAYQFDQRIANKIVGLEIPNKLKTVCERIRYVMSFVEIQAPEYISQVKQILWLCCTIPGKISEVIDMPDTTIPCVNVNDKQFHVHILKLNFEIFEALFPSIVKTHDDLSRTDNSKGLTRRLIVDYYKRKFTDDVSDTVEKERHVLQILTSLLHDDLANFQVSQEVVGGNFGDVYDLVANPEQSRSMPLDETYVILVGVKRKDLMSSQDVLILEHVTIGFTRNVQMPNNAHGKDWTIVYDMCHNHMSELWKGVPEKFVENYLIMKSIKRFQEIKDISRIVLPFLGFDNTLKKTNLKTALTCSFNWWSNIRPSIVHRISAQSRDTFQFVGIWISSLMTKQPCVQRSDCVA
jgi:hypothetical protein